MPFDVLLPQWGMGMNDGTVVKWLKQEGDAVEKGEPLVEIESSKVNGEVESPGAGTLGRIVVPEGLTVPAGARLGVVLAPGDDPAALPPPMAAPGPATAGASAGVQAAPARPVAGGRRRQATPVARRLARQLEIDIDTVAGTGPGGRITEEDVRRAAESGPSVPPAGVPVRRVVPLAGLRGTIARRMSESMQIPTVTLTTEVDVTETVALMARLVREWRRHRLRPQFQDLVLKATARALAETPGANAFMLGDEIQEIENVNLGFALSVPDGLLVPVIRNADEKNVLEIAQAVREMTRRVKSGRQTVEDFSGGTFTVTYLGSFGIDAFTPLLNPPQVGILAVGRVRQQPAVVNGELAVRSIAWLGITFDHRAWDGAPAAEFLRTVSNYLSSPEWMVA